MMPRARMVMGMGMVPEPSTTMLIREVENGYLIDVELKGEDEVRSVRFAKYIAPTHADLESRVRVILEAFEGRKPDANARIMANLQGGQQVDRKLMIVHQLKGGFMVVTAKPVRMKVDEAVRKARGFHMECTTEGPALPEEVVETVWGEEIRFDKVDIMDALLEFFGKPAEPAGQ